ncbi:recombinase family protein [Glutamicibacter creatinolyticus]|uniref:recombinase family protein n=1 Tax=Glutamicibacter creatinolyticus TaxID=162496 RepID=UPI0032168CBB
MRAGIYARISHDPLETTLGVQRQLEDCTREAERRGWQIVETYVDNDVSATRSKVRPEYDRMMSDVEHGHINALLVWDIDRLTRTPRELEDIIELADKTNLSMANIGGEIDLSTPQGKMTARIKGSVARHEADQMSRRMRRAFQQRALSGKQHSFPGFGYQRIERDGMRWDVAHPEQAALVLGAATRYAAGESLRSIVNDFNSQGIKAPRADRWNPTSLRQVLRRPVNIGKRQHKGEIVGDAHADPIMSEDLYHRVIARMDDPQRIKTAVGRTPRHLLTMIARCGLCGGHMRMSLAKTRGTKTSPQAYSCKECFKIRRKSEPVDEIVVMATLARLQDPSLLAALAVDNSDVLTAHRDKLEGLEARLDLAADQFAEGSITGDQLKRINAKIMPEVEESKRIISRLQGTNPVLNMAGADAAKRWEKAPLEIKRQIIDALMKITIMPQGSGGHFDPESIKIEWKV